MRPGGNQRLPRDLATEHALAVLVGTDAPEQVHLELFELEEIDQIVERTAHRAPMLPAARLAEEHRRGLEQPAIYRFQLRHARSIGMRTTFVPCSATITPKSPSCTASIASIPKRVAMTRSYAVGLPPRNT